MDWMWYLLLAHLVGDYALQSDRMAALKGQSLSVLTWHVTIYTSCIGITLWSVSAVTGAFDFFAWNPAGLLMPLFALHWTQDLIKGRYFNHSKQAYYADQVLHLAQLYAIRLMVS
jgi:hypothetical protein